MLSLQVDMVRRRRLMEGLGEEEVQERARLMSLGLPQAEAGLLFGIVVVLPHRRRLRAVRDPVLRRSAAEARDSF